MSITTKLHTTKSLQALSPKRKHKHQSKTMVSDILPSYQLHEYLSRNIETVISDLRYSRISNLNYSNPCSSIDSNDQLHPIARPLDSEGEGNNDTEWGPDSDINDSESLSDGVRSIPHQASDYLVNQFHTETNFRKSLLSNFYELRYKMQDAIIITVSINGLSGINDKTYTSGNLVEGLFRVYNKSSLDIDLGIVLVTLEGNYWWKTEKHGQPKLTTKSFLTMVEIEASMLDTPNVLKSGEYQQLSFRFIIPELDSNDQVLPPSLGNLHYHKSFNSEMADVLNKQREPADYIDSLNHFSISYSINVRSLTLNAPGDKLEIRKHTRHLIKYENTVKNPEAGNQPYSLTPEESLELFIKCYESRLSFYKMNPQTEEDETTNDELLNKKSSNLYHERNKIFKNMEVSSDYNPDEETDDDLGDWLKPETYLGSQQRKRVFQIVSRKKNSITSIPFDYNLLTPAVFKYGRESQCKPKSNSQQQPHPHPDLLLRLDTDLKLRKIELFSLTIFSTSKIPFKMSASWFLSVDEYCLFDKMIKPKVDQLLSHFTSIETALPLNELISISNINVKRTKLKTLKSKKLKTHADIYEINTKNLRTLVGSDLISPFQTDYCELFYFIRVSFKLAGDLTFKGKNFAYFEFPIQLKL
ncbi:unnamed protein product [Ambrosiozyma monospora]|uniref:Unnamed protein product n=1 Tax=Ambrosiozyma monospora TaxID=43982 RepID=A0ACB5SVC0_AMBMO|nr:unnamed protein product [Ambrosiozyma monospora]